MTKEEIVRLVVENNLLEEVYDTLHYTVMVKLGKLQDNLYETNGELRIIKKLADANRKDANTLEAIKAILSEEE